MVKFLQVDRTYNALVLLVVAFILRFPAFFKAPYIPSTNPIQSIIKDFIGSEQWLYTIICVLLSFTNAYLISYIVNRFNITRNKGYLIGFIYLLVSSFSSYDAGFSHIWIIDLILLILMIELFSLYRSSQHEGSIFNLGFWAIMLQLIYFQSIVLLVFFLIATLLLKKVEIKDFFLFAIGIVSSYYLIWLTYFIFDQPPLFWTEQFIEPFQFLQKIDFLDSKAIIQFLFISIVLVLSILKSQHILSKNINQTRQFLYVFYGLFIILILSQLFHHTIDSNSLLMVSIPLSFFVTALILEFKSDWIKELAFLLIIIIWISVNMREIIDIL